MQLTQELGTYLSIPSLVIYCLESAGVIKEIGTYYRCPKQKILFLTASQIFTRLDYNHLQVQDSTLLSYHVGLQFPITYCNVLLFH